MKKKMFRCQVIEDFTLEEYGKLENIKRRNVEKYGKLYIGDTFECDEKMARYLLGENDKNKCVVKVIEIKPEEENKNE